MKRRIEDLLYDDGTKLCRQDSPEIRKLIKTHDYVEETRPIREQIVQNIQEHAAPSERPPFASEVTEFITNRSILAPKIHEGASFVGTPGQIEGSVVVDSMSPPRAVATKLVTGVKSLPRSTSEEPTLAPPDITRQY